MADVEWIKLSADMFGNRKIRQIEHKTNGDTIIVIWIKLLCLAGSINDGGAIYLTPEVPYTEESLADELDRPLDIVQSALNFFRIYGMIEIMDGIIYLTSWEKYQNIEGLEKIREQTRERVANYRKKKRNNVTQGNATSNVTVTQGNAIEEEREKNKETDKNRMNEEALPAHSFTPNVDNSVENSPRNKIGGTLGQGVVFLSEEQMDDLLSWLSKDEFDYYVGIVAECELSGKKFTKKTHYQAICDMAKKDRETQKRS